MAFTAGSKEKKGPILLREQAPQKQVRLEAELQSELHGTRSATVDCSTTRLAERGVADLVVRSTASRGQQEVGAVKHVKCRRVELQGEPLRQLKVLRQRHVRRKETRADKLVASQVAEAAQTWRCKNGQVALRRWQRIPVSICGEPTLRPRRTGKGCAGKTAIRALIPATSQKVVATFIDAVSAVDIRRSAVSARSVPQVGAT